MSQKAAKMCKSPKNLLLADKVIEYEHLNTNCTIVGSNNLHLVKKPTLVTSVSPVYSTPSPGPYKSPSPQTMKPPTPQPTFPVMQIINPVISGRTLHQPAGNVIKLKPPLNILPKPAAVSGNVQQARQSPRPVAAASPAQIQVPPQAAIMQQPLLLNQMPMLAAAPGVRFILQPQTAKISPQVQQVQQTPQGLILQQAGGQQLLQLQPPRSQPMVRVLTNGVGLPATTYVTQMAPVQNLQTSLPSPATAPKRKPPPKKKKQKLDLANIMKLSGIGDDDDVMFESDASQSEGDASTSTLQEKKHPAPPIMLQQQQQPMMQVLNQTFQAQNAQPPPFGSFSIAAPNFTLGTNGLMAVPQRSNGGFKLALGEDGRLVLQHDPSLNQDLQSQLLLQSIFGLNGGCGSLVLQPSLDQQIHSQTVQTIQQQSVQTIQQQTVQSQTIQTVQHQIVQPQALQSIQNQLQGQIQSLLQQQNMLQQQPSIALQQQLLQQMQVQKSSQVTLPTTTNSAPNPAPSQNFFPSSIPTSLPTVTSSSGGGQGQQPVLKVQPFQKSQPPVQTVHPLHHQSPAPPPQPPPPPAQPTSYVVNLTPDQLEQLKRNGQLTVNGQTIFMQRPAAKEISEKKTPPKIKPIKKPSVSKIVVKEATPLPQPLQPSQPPQPPPPQPVVNHVNHVNHMNHVSHVTHVTHVNHVISGNNLDKIINSVAGGVATTTTTTKMKTAAIIQPSVMQQQHQHQHAKLVTAVAPVAPINAISKVMISPRCSPATPTPAQITSTPSGMVVTPITPLPSQVPPVSAAVSHHIVVSSGVSLISPVPNVSVTMTMAPMLHNHQGQQGPQSMPGLTMVSSTLAPRPAMVPVRSKEVVVKMDHPDVERFLGQLMEDTQTQKPGAAHQQITLQSVAPQQQQAMKLQISQPPPKPQQQSMPTLIQPPPQPSPVPVPAASLPPSPAPAPSPAPTPPLPQPQAQMIVTSPLVLPQIPPNSQGQRIHTIQLTPQKQQHLKSIQLQIQTLSARMQPGASSVEMQNALKVLFQEQQKILASGKLLPPDKVFYHGNQIIVNNSTMVKNEVLNPSPKAAPTLAPAQSPAPVLAPAPPKQPAVQLQEVKPVKPVLIQPKVEPTSVMVTSVVAPTVSTTVQSHTQTHTQSQSQMQSQMQAQLQAQQAAAQAESAKVALYKRAQLIEQQMNTDQNGAIKPDIHTPFRDKADACKRLIRYHCFEQPVLSEKDLSKADEIFELTARHFIGKFGRMVDKYRFLLHKESQRHVQTSELMMLDRMFLSEEQQSLIKLRQEIDELQVMQQQELAAAQQPEMHAEDYDEWACIQRELGCLADAPDAGAISNSQAIITPGKRGDAMVVPTPTTSTSSTITTAASVEQQATKRPCSGMQQEKCDNKKQRVDVHKGKVINTHHNGLQSSFVLKSSALTNINGAEQLYTSQARPTTSAAGASNSYQRFNINQQQYVQHNHFQQQQHQQHMLNSYNCSMTSTLSSSGSSASTRSNNEENDSIDEQVQSAIDSILNLQQNNLELDETMQNMLS